MPSSYHPPRSLLAVLAHPDDETFGIGGTLALYAQRGVEVYLVCATRGEAGEMDPDCLEGFTSVAERRVSELHCAAGKLGLSGVYFLNYRDSGMAGSPDNQNPSALAAAPLEEVTAQVVEYIRKLHPQVIITFDPIGGYKHPDHIAIQKATVYAFQAAGDSDWKPPAAFPVDLPPYQPQKLYFQVFPKKAMRMVVRLLPLIGRDPHKFGRNGDIDLQALVKDGDFPTHARIDYTRVQNRKDAAAACHASQLGSGPPRRGPISWIWRQMGKYEHFMRAYPPTNPRLHERDLFEGI